ncbi:ABC transporter substrate-binding protein [Sinomonas sp. G460-2]|uniref:ABC transporter substrate-binding protein n=1 Tax=Sinomonas sp. G460-2 TaxID=3393464 RepID=UPI0039EFCC5C
MSDFSQNAPLSRRRMLQLFAVTGAAASLAACAGPGSTKPGAGSSLNTANKSGKVSFAHWRAEDKDVFAKLIDKFKQANPDIDVTQDITTSTDYQAQALQRIRSGAIGDVAPAFRGSQFESFVSSGIFTDLGTSGLTDKYTANLITSGAENGKQYGYPYQIVLPMPVVNTDILGNAGISSIPTDWDSYLAMLEAIKSKGITPVAFPGADAGNAGQLFNSMIMNVAPSDDMCTKIQSGELKCTDDWFLQMLRYYRQLAPYMQPNSAGSAVEPAEQLFATGKAAILATGSYHVAAVRKLGAKFPVDLAPPITSAKGKARYEGTYNSTFILGINSASKVQGAALAWLQFLSDPANATAYANATAQFSPVKGVEYTDPDLKALRPWLDKKTILAPRYQFTDLDVQHAVEAAAVKVLGGTDPAKAADDAQKVVDQHVKAK